MKKHLTNRLLSLLLVVAMLAGFMVPAQAADTHSHAVAVESEAPALEKLENNLTLLPMEEAMEAEEEALYADEDIVRVSIVLEKESTMDAGFSTENIVTNTEAMCYRQELKAEQELVTTNIETAVGNELDVKWNMTLVANIISANVPYGQIDDIEAVNGVKEVVIENRFSPAVVSREEAANPNMATSPGQIGSFTAWTNGYTGAGSRIAIIDTGSDTDHQSFAASGLMYALHRNAETEGKDAEEYIGSLNLLDAEEIAAVFDELHVSGRYRAEELYVNEKIPFGYNYIDEDLDITHDHDDEGSHGSHVAGIATANTYIPNGDGTYAKALDAVFTQGVAPDAQLITMKVFGKKGGAYDSDYMVAIEDAIILGCDAVNLSLGSSNAGFVTSAVYQDIMDSLTKSNIVATMAAGNDYGWAEKGTTGTLPFADDINFNTVGSPGSYTNSLGVASVDNIGQTGDYFRVGETNFVYNHYTKDGWTNAPLTTLAGEHEYVFLDGGHAGLDSEWEAVADDLKGKIAVCYRGTISFYQKAEYAVKHGAIALIVCNNTSGTINMDLTDYTQTAPCVSITQAQGGQLLSMSTRVDDEKGNARYYTGKMTISATAGSGMSDSAYYTMSDFSSWGVPSSLTLKPEITAPGGGIYSVNGIDPSGKAYENNSGTSMATPQVAGMVAVIAEYIRENDLVQKTGLSARQLAQSLLMSTAEPVVEEKSEYYYSVLKQGAGLANVGSAVTANSYLLMDESATASWADGKIKAELGEDADRNGQYSFSFTLNNLTNTARGYTLAADVFTQDLSSTGKYLSAQTTALAAEVTYLVDGKPFVPSSSLGCDLNDDGQTDLKDAQIVLDYCAGLINEIAPIADVNGDGNITTYDAYLILTTAGDTSEITLPAGGKVEITVQVKLPAALKQELDAKYVNGAYLEGYVWVKPTSTTEGLYTDVTHSIPVLGFYGSWTEPTMYDRTDYTSVLYGEKTTPYTDERIPNVLTLKMKGATTGYYQVGNPYLLEETNPADRMAVNGTTNLSSYRISLIRNAAYVAGYVMNEAGDVLYVSTPTPNVHGAYFYTAGAMWYATSISATIGKTPARLGLKEGDKVTAGVVAIPEYYAMNKDLTANDIKMMIENGELGEGAFIGTTMLIDNTAPVVTDVVKFTEGEGLTITASDENYIAAIQVADEDGMVLTTVGAPGQTGKNQTITVNVDLTDMFVGEKCIVAVLDYAGNMATYAYRYGGENKYVVPGTMFGWTKSKDRGETVARWSQIDVDTLWWGDAENYSGTTTVAKTGYEDDMFAAAYMCGYVFMVCDDGNIYRTKHGKWTNEKVFTNWEAAVDAENDEKIYDIAADYFRKKVWLCSNQGNIYEMNMDNGEITLAYSVTFTNPYITKPSSSNLKYRQPRSIIVDKDGRFYAVNYPGNVNYTFLYTWTMEDVVTTTNEDGTLTRAITDLAPINNTRAGKIPQDRSYLRFILSYDYDKDIIYATYTDNTTAGRDTHTLYKLNKTDGTSAPANSYLPEGATAGSAIIHSNMFGIYIVPQDDAGLLPDIFTATSVKAVAPRTEVLVGATMTMTAEVGPWNLDDKSVTWSSSDESIATIDEKTGEVTFHKTGKVNLTATTVLKPFLSNSAEITVGTYPTDLISAAIGKADGTYHIAQFNPADLSAVTSIKELDTPFMGGGFHDGRIWYHDGNKMYAMDMETLELEDKGAIPDGAAWSDSTTEPLLEVDTFNNLIGLCFSGTEVLLWNEDTGLTRTYDIRRFLDDDPAALIACADYKVKNSQYGYNYYILTEGGILMKMYLWCSELTDNTYYQNFDDPMYATGLELMGVATVGSGNYGSMIYDEDTGYLLVTRTLLGEETTLYAIDPNNGVTAPIGTFSEDIRYVTGMYKYDRTTELAVVPNTTTVEMFSDETYDLGVRVLPITYGQEITCSSSDETVATVDNRGTITAKAAGTATITITSAATNDAGQKATAKVTVNVTAIQGLSAQFHAQITDATGTYWAKIDTANMTITKEGTASVVLAGAGAHNGKIYGTDGDYVSGGHFYAIDPSNGYSVTQGAAVEGSDAMLDGTTMPFLETNCLNNNSGTVLYKTGNLPAFINADRQALLLTDLATGEHAGYRVNLTNTRGLAAVTYAGPGKQGNYEGHYYYLLENDGDVHRLTYYPALSGSNVVYRNSFKENFYRSGLIFQNKERVTMTYINDGTNLGLLIADSSGTETELFFVNMGAEPYVTTKVGTLRGVTNLVGAYVDSEIAPQPDTGDGENGLMPGLFPENEEKEHLVAVNKLVGSTSTSGLHEVLEKGQDDETVTVNGSGAYTISEPEDSTNGKIIITYDPSALTYVSCLATVKPYAINVDEANGVITYTYASKDVIKANNGLAMLVFTYAGDTVDTQISAKTLERNDRLVDEEPRVTLVQVGCKHNYEVTASAEPTCTEDGYITYTCSKCGDSYTDTIQSQGHKYDGGTVSAPTCTEMGYTTYTCTVCGESYKADYVDALGHHFGDWETVTEPGCDAKGQQKRTCNVCGEVEYRDTDPKGHNYTAVETAPTCTEMGYTTYTCSVCGNSYKADYVDATGHNYTAVVTEPTCTEMGYTTYTCSVCGESYRGEFVPSTGHSFGQWETVKEATCTEAGEEKRTCAVCGETETRMVEALGHSYLKTVTEPTCTNVGYTSYTCQRCGDQYVGDYIPAKGHSYTKEVTAPTCTESGYTMYTCSVCGHSYKADYIPAKGHSYTRVVTDPTCTDLGYTTFICSVCDHRYTGEYQPALGHVMGDWTVTKAVTCTEDGEESRSCAVCALTEKRAVPATGHHFGDWMLTREATCTDKGVETRYCDGCDLTETRETEAYGHSFGEWTVTKAPTCTEKGEESRICACGETEKRTVAALGHNCTTVTVPPTCTADGYTTYECTVCGYSYRSDIVPATGHRYEAVVTPPTCTDDGYTTNICSVCGESYISDYVDAKGHVYGEWTVNKPATCTEEGTETRTCACGEKQERSIPATGHHFGDWEVTREANCTENGEETRTCTCGETEKRAVAALGHKLLSETVAPTCTADGYTQHTCSVCGHTYRDSFVPATGHDYEATVTAPTCTEVGYTTCTCCVCADSYVSDYVPALGHTTELVNVKESTCTEDGYTGDEVCTVCGETVKTGEVVPAFCPSAAYTDLNRNQWYHEYTDYVIENGLMNGVGGDKFSPNGTVNRGMMVTVLYRMAGEPEVTGESKFADVKAGQWYTDAIVWAEANGIAKGLTDDTFAPNTTVTREQAATFLYRYVTVYLGVEVTGGADLSRFKDASSISGYAQEAMAWAVAEELFQGFEDGTIQAKATLTRVQLAKLLTVLDQKF